MSEFNQHGAALVSTLASDPDMRDLVEMFVGDLPGRVAAMEAALAAADCVALSRLSHQLKGAAGGYGFPAITDAARTLEASARAQAEFTALEQQFKALADLCKRATANPEPTH